MLQRFLEDLRELNGAQIVVGALAAFTAVQLTAWAVRSIAGGKQQRPGRSLRRPASTLPVLDNLVDFIRHTPDFHDWIAAECQAAQGEPWLLRALGQPDFIIVTDPKVVEDVQRTQFDNFAKGEYGTSIMRDFMGQGIFSVDGADWVRQRKTASNLFTMRALRDSMAVTIRKHATVLLRVLDQAMRQQQTVDLFKVINQFTMEAFSELAFGIHMNGLETGEEHPFHHAFDTALAALGHRLMKPVWFWKLQRALSLGQEGVLTRNMKIIHDTVLEFIAQTLMMRNSKTSRDTHDIVSLFLDHVSYTPASEEEEFDPIMLRDIVVNFMVAGKDTTAEALSWFFVSLRDHPEVERKIREEIMAKLPDLAKPNTTASMEDVQQLVYLEAALKETLRLFPSVPFNAREALSDTFLVDGTFVPKGAMLGFPAYGIGRMTTVWGEDAEQFNPDRFIDSATGKLCNVSAYQFNAFYGGPRMCLGVTLAMLEMKIVVASLLPKFHLQMASEKKITYEISITLPVKDPLLVHVQPMEPALKA